VYGSAAAIPADYYTQLRAFAGTHPIAIAEMGYSSAASSAGMNNGTEADQAAYLKRMIDEAAALKMPFVVWFAGWDPSFAKDSAYSVFQHIGLRRTDDTEKPAWQEWATAARRPYRPG
jgi:exo-beta-1,3-glucanase (GH17 family)